MSYPIKPTGQYSLRDYDFAQADSKKIPMDEYLFKNGYKNAEESETESVPDAHSQNWLFDLLHRNLKYAIGTADENKNLIQEINSSYIPSSDKTNDVLNGSAKILTSGGAYTNLVKRKSTTEATGSTLQGVYIDTNGIIQPCTAVTSTYSSSSDAPINGKALNSAISGLSSTVNILNSLKFTNKNLTIGVGTTSLKSYLPNDDKQYLVWLHGTMYGDNTGGQYYGTVHTDLITTAGFIQIDGDSGRAQRAKALTIVPVGSERRIEIEEGATPDYHVYMLHGYCRI